MSNQINQITTKLTRHIRRTVNNAIWSVSAPATTQALKILQAILRIKQRLTVSLFCSANFLNTSRLSWNIWWCWQQFQVSTGPLCESHCLNEGLDTVSSPTNVKCLCSTGELLLSRTGGGKCAGFCSTQKISSSQFCRLYTQTLSIPFQQLQLTLYLQTHSKMR